MPTQQLFATHVYTSALQRSGAREFNRQLLMECRQLREDDLAGRRWSASNYPGGYTSYGSCHRLQRLSPTFAALESKLQRHVNAFVRGLDWDLDGRKLVMTDCWINIMSRHTVHSLHLHPLSTVSGSYYVQVPAGAPGNRPWVTVPAVAGRLVLFESWLRHEVVPQRQSSERISVSFNYHWF